MAKPLDVDANSFDSAVLDEGAPVLVDFWSETCPHCLQLNPEFDRAAQAGHGDVRFAKISAQTAGLLFGRYGVHAVPTLVLFKGGDEAARREGTTTAQTRSSPG
jgi:thioredoxin 2